MSKIMNIHLDNIIYSLQTMGGISVYWGELTKKLSLMKKDVQILQYQDNKWCRYSSFKKQLQKADIFHSSYYRISKQKDIVNIITVYDFTYEYYRSGLAKYIHTYQKMRAIKNSDGIICISENTKNDLIKFNPNIDENKIQTIYLSADESFELLESPKDGLKKVFKELIDKKYVLYVGDRSDYKNFDIAVKTTQQIHNCILVIVGGGALRDGETKLLQKDYFHYQGISAEDLNILYNNAFCLLYPSSYEGFGIPVLEAMRAGCPVVSTNLSSIPEVAGDAGLLVNNIKVEEFVKEIEKLEDNEFRDKIIAKGLEQSKKFSWDRCFEETFEFYKEVVGKKFS